MISAVVFFTKTPSCGFWQFFPTGTYERIATMRVESELCYEKYHKNKKTSFTGL